MAQLSVLDARIVARRGTRSKQGPQLLRRDPRAPMTHSVAVGAEQREIRESRLGRAANVKWASMMRLDVAGTALPRIRQRDRIRMLHTRWRRHPPIRMRSFGRVAHGHARASLRDARGSLLRRRRHHADPRVPSAVTPPQPTRRESLWPERAFLRVPHGTPR